MKALNATERRVLREATAIVQTVEFERLYEAGLQRRAAEQVIMGVLIIVEPELPPGYCGMSLFGENGFVLGLDAFTSMEQLHKTLLWELYRLLTGQDKVAIGASDAGRLRALTADFTERAWPWFHRSTKPMSSGRT